MAETRTAIKALGPVVPVATGHGGVGRSSSKPIRAPVLPLLSTELFPVLVRWVVAVAAAAVVSAGASVVAGSAAGALSSDIYRRVYSEFI